MPDIRLILPDIRSVFNVGGIFRTADAVGVSHIYLCGYTPTPLDRFGRERKDFHKSALGAELTVPWTQSEDINELIMDLKASGHQIVAVEQSAESQSYLDIDYSDKVVIIMGNEVDGVEDSVLKVSDNIAEIPMIGQKESLNVGVAAGVVLYQVNRGK